MLTTVGVARKATNTNNNILAANFIVAKVGVNLTNQKRSIEIYTKINIQKAEIDCVNSGFEM